MNENHDAVNPEKQEWLVSYITKIVIYVQQEAFLCYLFSPRKITPSTVLSCPVGKGICKNRSSSFVHTILTLKLNLVVHKKKYKKTVKISIKSKFCQIIARKKKFSFMNSMFEGQFPRNFRTKGLPFLSSLLFYLARTQFTRFARIAIHHI